jgi:uncharacterized protein YkwD
MAWKSFPILLILLILGVGACSQSSPGADTSAPTAPSTVNSEVALAIADLTNVERNRAGLAALSVDARLNTAARLQVDQLASMQTLDHEVPNGPYPSPPDRLAAAGYQWQAYGENLASGYRTAAEAMNGWMNSPGHRANIVNGNFTEIGTAYATDPTGRPYYVQVFGRPR